VQSDDPDLFSKLAGLLAMRRRTPSSNRSANISRSSTSRVSARAWDIDRHEDCAEKPCALARERCRVPVPLKFDPSWVGHAHGAGVLHDKSMEPAVARKWRQQVLLAPWARGNCHATALFGGNYSCLDQVKELGIRMVHHRSEPSRSLVIERRERNNQTAGRAQLGGSQRQERLPVLRSLAIELSPDGAAAAWDEEVVGNLKRNSAEPDGGVRTPSQIDVTGREQAPIKRAADCIRKDLRFALQIALRITLQQREHFAEVVGWKIGVANKNHALRTNARPQSRNCRSQWRQ
jgi:hypothetical protein